MKDGVWFEPVTAFFHGNVTQNGSLGVRPVRDPAASTGSTLRVFRSCQQGPL